MIAKLKALIDLFSKGKSVADPAKWKNRQISITLLTGFLIAVVQLAKAFGVEIPIDNETATAIAGGILAIVNTIFTITTSTTVGLPTTPVREAESTVPSVQSADATIEAPDRPTSLPHVDEAVVGQSTVDTIDEATRQRAIEWAKLHSVIKPSINNSNGLASDA